jgi:hypothetical protein
MANELGPAIRDEVVRLLGPLASASLAPDAVATLVRAVGEADALAADAGLQAEVLRLAGLAQGIAALDDASLDSWEGVLRVLRLARELAAAVRGAQSAITDPPLAARAQDLGRALGELLFARYLRTHHPRLFRAAAALTLITPAERGAREPLVIDEGGAVIRMPGLRDRFHFDRVADLLRDPLGVLREAYLPGEMQRAQDAHLAAQRLFPLLTELAAALDLGCRSEAASLLPPGPPPPLDPDPEDGIILTSWPPPEVLEIPDPGPFDPAPLMREYLPRFAAYLPAAGADGDAGAKVGVLVTASSAEHPGAVRGFVVAPAAEAGFSETRDGWRLQLEAGGAIPAFVLGPDGIELAPQSDPMAGGSATFVVERIPGQEEPAFRLGADGESRIELGAVRFRVRLELGPQRQTTEVSLEAGSAALILEPGEDDGFLRTILPADGARVPFDVGLVLSSDRGLELKGGAGLELALSPDLRLGPLSVPTLRLALDPRADEVGVVVSGDLRVKLGPATMLVAGLGVRVGVSEGQAAGSFGPVDLDTSLTPPTGVGLDIDAPAVSGGGFLLYDAAQKRYAGVARLQLQALALSAIGLLDTRMPDGSSGFSFLLAVMAEDFQPIDLGLGFRLTGIGGMLGINRRVAVDVLRAGLKNRVLDAVLFPEDPVRNAAAIIRTAGQVFPPTPGQHFVAPVAEISWGLGELLTAQVGVAVEFPSPLRIVLLGQIRGRFPSKEKALVRLNMDMFGVVDIDKGEAMVLATLFDSKLLAWNVTGDAAFYARWEGDPTFILSVGGFHPAFPAPPELPALERLTMSLSQGDRVRIRFTWYLALTSNTLQHGARWELHVSAASFSIDGHLGYDTLIQFDPFGFMVSFSAGVGLKWHGHTLASVQLSGALSGPSPWHVQGKATFKIWRFSKSVDFDKTIGEKEPLPPMPVVDPLPALVAALGEPTNWEAALPAQADSMVTLGAARVPGKVLLHPLGSVSVRQQVLPLEVPIGKFGNARLAQERSYRIIGVDVGGAPVAAPTPLRAHFARGQFQEMTQEERLTRRSFEEMQAGVRVEPDALTYGGRPATANTSPAHRRDVELTYETVVLGDEPAATQEATAMSLTPTSTETFTPTGERLLRQANFGAAALAATRRTGAARFRHPRPPVVPVESFHDAKEMIPA